MKTLSLELPPGLFTDQQTQILNERLREIQQNLGIAETVRGPVDLKGNRLLNLGDARDPLDALNLRTMEQRMPPPVSAPGGGGGGSPNVTTETSPSEGMLVFSVQGALAIQAGAAPLVSLPRARTVKEIVGLLQGETDEGPVEVDLFVGAKRYATLTIPAKATQAKLSGSGLGVVAANQPIRLDVVKVGLAPMRPGTGLSVMVRFA